LLGGRGNVPSPAELTLELEVYNAVMDAYGKDRFILECGPFVVAQLLVEDGYLLSEPPVDIVIHAQDLIRQVER
jgi:hypothetical protein